MNGEQSLRTTLAMVFAALVIIVALLWAAASRVSDGELNNGGGHAAALGLNGYAGLARVLGAAGYGETLARSPAQLNTPGLLVLTPDASTPGTEITKLANRHLAFGPVVVIEPKWLAASVDQALGAKPGWVTLLGPQISPMQGFHDELNVTQTPLAGGGWQGMGLHGVLPYPSAVYVLKGPGLVPLVKGSDGRILAAQVLGTDAWPVPNTHALYQIDEPDLLNNAGLARPENAALAEALFAAMANDRADGGGPERRVTFDLTLNGLGRPISPMALAFSPPWLAATLCLIFAALAAGWRSLLRFGPPLAEERAIAFGKRALVGSAAGLILRSHRERLLAEPYAAAVRERVARALGLPRALPAPQTIVAIDRALAARGGAEGGAEGGAAFSAATEALLTAQGPAAIVAAAARLHEAERILTR